MTNPQPDLISDFLSRYNQDVMLADWTNFIDSGFQLSHLSTRLFQFLMLSSPALYEHYWKDDKRFFWMQTFDHTTWRFADFVSEFATTPMGEEIHDQSWFDRLNHPVYGDLYAQMVKILDQVEAQIFDTIDTFEHEVADDDATAQFQDRKAKHPKASPEELEEAATRIWDDTYDDYDAIGYPVTVKLRHQIRRAIKTAKPTQVSHLALFQLLSPCRLQMDDKPPPLARGIGSVERSRQQKTSRRRQTNQKPPMKAENND